MNKKKTNFKLIIFVLVLLIQSGCSTIKKHSKQEEVFKCYCIENELYVGYMPPEFFENKSYADTLKRDYIKIYFPNLIKDTLEIFFNNRKIAEYCNINNTDPEKHFLCDYSNEGEAPIITVRLKGNINNCFQLKIDDRFRLMSISRIADVWYVTYSNFHVPTY